MVAYFSLFSLFCNLFASFVHFFRFSSPNVLLRWKELNIENRTMRNNKNVNALHTESANGSFENQPYILRTASLLLWKTHSQCVLNIIFRKIQNVHFYNWSNWMDKEKKMFFNFWYIRTLSKRSVQSSRWWKFFRSRRNKFELNKNAQKKLKLDTVMVRFIVVDDRIKENKTAKHQSK